MDSILRTVCLLVFWLVNNSAVIFDKSFWFSYNSSKFWGLTLFTGFPKMSAQTLHFWSVANISLNTFEIRLLIDHIVLWTRCYAVLILCIPWKLRITIWEVSIRESIQANGDIFWFTKNHPLWSHKRAWKLTYLFY